MLKRIVFAALGAVMMVMSGCASNPTITTITPLQRASALDEIRTRGATFEMCFLRDGKTIPEGEFPFPGEAKRLSGEVLAAFSAAGIDVQVVPCTWGEFGKGGPVKLVTANVTSSAGGWLFNLFGKRPPAARKEGGEFTALLKGRRPIVFPGGSAPTPEFIKGAIEEIVPQALPITLQAVVEGVV